MFICRETYMSIADILLRELFFVTNFSFLNYLLENGLYGPKQVEESQDKN
jgi:hypothetical protein